MFICPKRVTLALFGVLLSFHAYATSKNETFLQPANPALTGFVNSAVDDNPRVVAARARLAASEARTRAAGRPLYNPELTLGTQDAETREKTISLDQTIDWSGKREARSLVAREEAESARAEYLLTRREVALELLQGLTAWQTTSAREDLAEQRVSIMSEFASLSRKRFEQGDLNQVELSVAALAYTQARITHADVSVELAEAKQQIMAIEPDVQPEDWPHLDSLQPLPKVATERLVARLPEVLSSRGLLRAAQATVELRRREKKPDPTLSLSGGKEEKATLLGLDLSIPLYVRNRFTHEVTAAIEDSTVAQKTLDDLLLRSQSRIVNSGLRYDLYYKAWEDWQKSGSLDLDEQGRQLQLLWESGEISTTEFLLQIQQTLDTRDSILLLEQRVWSAWLEWLLASGTIDNWLDTAQAP